MIKKYRKKPVVVEAVQWTGTKESLSEVLEFTDNAVTKYKPYEDVDTHPNCIVIPTLEGDHLASKGDYIIKGIKGEFYPCKSDIFEMTYEVVETFGVENV